jgi:hypothetical protein
MCSPESGSFEGLSVQLPPMEGTMPESVGMGPEETLESTRDQGGPHGEPCVATGTSS